MHQFDSMAYLLPFLRLTFRWFAVRSVEPFGASPVGCFLGFFLRLDLCSLRELVGGRRCQVLRDFPGGRWVEAVGPEPY